MTQKYKNINTILRNDPTTSLKFWMFDMSYGILNGRVVSIEEPNPHKGTVANPCSGLDQQFLHGSRWSRRGYEFHGRDTLEALNLLEQKARGKDPKNTIGYSSGSVGSNKEKVSGYSTSQGGIDNWLFANFILNIFSRSDELYITLRSQDFSMQEEIISSLPIQSVDEGIHIYEQNTIDINTLQDLNEGVHFSNRLYKKTPWLDEKVLLADVAGHVVNNTVIAKYYSELEKLSVFDIPKPFKDGLFIKMVERAIYQDSK